MLGALRRGGVLCFVLDCLFVTGERGEWRFDSGVFFFVSPANIPFLVLINYGLSL